ncbi:UDP-N-acetylglucosamine 2-epimerase (non-hydrolyzing) [Aureimonas fodinaquatilis]|uniref:UDP-N-acetylglucosamine 2-epimerase (non-hydrolyzing) n=1 Tax=Aureimonas fodinaquatilis TaxID=2565783 RepID=A0A5B0DYW9_9HYPH|nr:UDP-N-acetylglucosamine 2-epimerase (non-hydrolyzing) [Aureimonas fodinaquatilis]
MNRTVVDRISDAMFAPTAKSRANLLSEGLDDRRILVTGNTVIDALVDVAERLRTDARLRAGMAARFAAIDASKRMILVTGHRRESFGNGFEQICHALAQIADRGDVEIVYPVHLNPNVREPVQRILADRRSIHLIEPQAYLEFVYLMTRAHLILTDSGGVQEEAPSLGKPVLVMREVTERPEAVEAGTVELVGANRAQIVKAVERLLDDEERYSAFSRAHNPYGDGAAARRIVGYLEDCAAGMETQMPQSAVA